MSIEENLTIMIGVLFIILFGASLYSSSNQLKQTAQKMKSSSDKTPEVKKGTYSVSPFESICNECKIHTVSDEMASKFTTSTTVSDGEFPLCFDHNRSNQKCCAIKKDDIYFGCPKFCFDNIRESIEKGEEYTEDQYKALMKENKYCNTV